MPICRVSAGGDLLHTSKENLYIGRARRKCRRLIALSGGLMQTATVTVPLISNENELERILHRALVAAYLLSGNTERSEAVVAKAIEECDSNDEAELLSRVALEGTRGEPCGNTEWTLPPELRKVLHLPSTLRHCFVLRILLNFPTSACARLLRLDARALNQKICEASKRLAV